MCVRLGEGGIGSAGREPVVAWQISRQVCQSARGDQTGQEFSPFAPAHDLRTVAMNQPSRAEKFVLPDGVRKLTFTRDTKVANAGTYVVQKEDHTLGNIVRMCVPIPRSVPRATHPRPA